MPSFGRPPKLIKSEGIVYAIKGIWKTGGGSMGVYLPAEWLRKFPGINQVAMRIDVDDSLVIHAFTGDKLL